jgi:hypothetical protein
VVRPSTASEARAKLATWQARVKRVADRQQKRQVEMQRALMAVDDYNRGASEDNAELRVVAYEIDRFTLRPTGRVRCTACSQVWERGAWVRGAA